MAPKFEGGSRWKRMSSRLWKGSRGGWLESAMNGEKKEDGMASQATVECRRSDIVRSRNLQTSQGCLFVERDAKTRES
jgi:hypothetical protein